MKILVLIFSFSLGYGILTGLFIYFSKKRKKYKLKKFLSEINKNGWTAKRIYVKEKNGGLNFFIEPIFNKKKYYNELKMFNREHCPPAHIETVLNVEIETLKTTHIAYVSKSKYKELVFKKLIRLP